MIRSWSNAGPLGATLALVLLGCDQPPEGIESTQGAVTLSGIRVLTRAGDNQRTGANLSETTLNTSNVNARQFGKLFTVTIDDAVFAQVLFASGVPIGGVSHDTFFVATAKNSIFAFDAGNGAKLWSKTYMPTGARPGIFSEVGGGCKPYQDFTGNIGIVGTPVIDASTGTMYFVTRTVENGATRSRLRAIDVTNGAERSGSGVSIEASKDNVVFRADLHNQRAALALADNTVYVTYGAFCDTGAYHGWVLGRDKTTLANVSTFLSTRTGAQGGIWMGGAGPAIDSAGNVYVTTGNGTFNPPASGSLPLDFGESTVKLAPRTLQPLSFFTPSNFAALNGNDDDFGSAGPTLLPGQNVVVNGGKEGKVFAMSTSALGGIGNDQQILHSFQAIRSDVRPNVVKHIHGSLVAWQSPQGLNLYTWGENDFLHIYRFNTTTKKFNTTPVASGQALPPFGMPGGMMTLSANGGTAGSGILWASTPLMGNANNAVTPGILRAYDAETLNMLWDSSAAFNDTFTLAKFVPPTVASGKVFIPTAAGAVSLSGFVSVYGLKSSMPTAVTEGRFVYLRKRFTENPGVCIDVPGSSTGNSVQLESFSCNGTGAQIWQFNVKAPGLFEVKRAGTNLCMDVRNGAATVNNVVQQFVCNDSAAQRFAIDARAGGIQLRFGSNLCVDVVNNSNADGALLQLFTCGSNNDAQIFTPMPPQLKKRNFTIDQPRIVENGRVLCVDAPSSSESPGPLQVWACNFTDAQNWQLNDKFNGQFEIVRNKTGLCLDHDNGNPQRITQNFCNGSASQSWLWDAVFQPPLLGAGKQLRSVDTNKCVDIQGGGDLFVPLGTILQLFPCNGSPAQVFDL